MKFSQTMTSLNAPLEYPKICECVGLMFSFFIVSIFLDRRDVLVAFYGVTCRFLFCLAFLILTGCTGVVTDGSVSKLRPGMTVDETTKIMGSPTGTQFVNGMLVRKYTAWRPFVGYVPLYLIYDYKTGCLASWQENLAEYDAQQNLMIDAWNPLVPQQIDVDQNIRARFDHRVW
jgi:hypothetical protein